MKNVLVVDDSEFSRRVLKEILTNNGYNIIGEAENGKDMLQKYDNLSPDIVTLDITMPVMDGIEALRQLMKTHKNACVVMCSAVGDRSIIVDAIKSGAKDYITKPFQESIVMDCFGKL